MALVTIHIEDCRDKVSPDCTKTFERIAGRGRPALSCLACRTYKPPTKPRKAKAVVVVEPVPAERTIECPCGTSFTVATSGRGRKPSKCSTCRDNGTVYRTNDDGIIEAIRAATLAEEAREKAEQAGKERAGRLVEMMNRLHERDAKRRLVAV
jgi:hypothetical protein